MKIKFVYVLLSILCIGISSMGCSNQNKSALNTEAQTAKQYLVQRGYTVIEYKGNVDKYVLFKAKLTQSPYNDNWGLQSTDPTQLIGKSVDVERFIVKNHPLDNWQAGNVKSKGETDLSVYIVDNQVVGGISSPVVDQPLAGGSYSLDGRTLEQVQSKDYQTWKTDWNKKFGN